MFKHRKIKAGRSSVEAFLITLSSKRLILLRGNKGYVMCGYLDMKVAEKFKDAAVKVTGVSTISGAINSTVSACTGRARRLGVKVGQPVKEALKLLA